ncbi:MAG: autotransporter-associated beta strand repeat-containing protein, partial [Verrucomicrobiota bacterium]
MKTNMLTRSLAVMSLLALSADSALAASGNWTNNASSVWSATTNWNPNVAPGTAAGDTVGLNADITTNRTVTLNQAATVGTLNLGDPTAPYFSYTLAGSSTLTFNNSSAGAQLNQTTAGSGPDTNSAPITLADNLTVNNVNGLTLSGVISGSGKSLTKTGSGTLTLTAQNTFSGGAFVNAGTLKMTYGGGAGCLRNTSLTVNPGATAILTAGDTLGYTGGQVTTPVNAYGGTLDNASSINNGYVSTFNLMGGVMTNSVATDGTHGWNFAVNGSALNTLATNIPSTIYGNIVLRGNTLTITVAQGTVPSGIDLLVPGNIVNSGGNTFNKAGAGIMAITGTNNATVNINAGTLQIGDGTSANGKAAGNIANNSTLVFANPTAATYSSVLSGSGALVKTGAGTLTLSGANNFTGTTTVSNGTLLVTTAGPVGSTVTVEDNAVLAVNASANQTYIQPSTLNVGSSTGGTLQFVVSSTTLPIIAASSTTINGTATINIASAPLTIGASYPLFSGYTSGTLALGTQPSAVSGQLVDNSGTIYYQVTNVAINVWTAAVNTNWDTVTANWTNSLGGNKFGSGAPAQFDDTANGSSPLLVNITNSSVTSGPIIVTNATKAYVIGGAIAGSGSLTKNGNSTLTLTGTNSFSGALGILGGTVEIGGAGLLGGGTFAASIDDETVLKYNSTASQTLSGVISGNGALVVSNGTVTLSSGSSTFVGGVTNVGVLAVGANSIPTSGTVTSGPLGTGTLTLNGGTLQNSAGISGLANAIYVGSGSATIKLGIVNNLTLTGTLDGPGNLTIAPAGGGLASLYLSFSQNTASGTITIPSSSAGNQTVTRFGTATAGSATAAWSIGGATDRGTTFDFGTGTIEFGSLSGSGLIQGNAAGLKTIQVGALGTDTTFGGVFKDTTGTVGLTKVGVGKLTLTGASTSFSGGVNLNGGTLAVSNASALASSGPITFGGGTLQYSPANQADYSARITNSASPIAIDVNGTNVTFASALSSNNTGGLVLTNSTGAGKLTLTAASTYIGDTVIKAGRLALSGSGAIPSTNIIVASAGIFDVSGVSYTLNANTTLSGSGIVTGTVATASSTAAIQPDGAGAAGTLSFSNNLALGSGASVTFDISTSRLSGNDQIVVATNLTLSSSDIIHINALGGSANLDQAGDYVLFSVGGASSMTTQPVLVFDNTPPDNFSHYSIIQVSGKNVVLHYSASSAPVITSIVVTNTADGSTYGTHNQSATVYVTVTPGSGSLGGSSVTADLSSFGGSATQVLTQRDANDWSYTFVIGPSSLVGLHSFPVTVTDSLSAHAYGSGTFTVNTAAQTWSGLAANDNWGSGANWTTSIAPGYVGDSVIFTGSLRTSPNLETNYNVAGITFDGSASSFTNGSATGKTLTLSGPVNNSSGNPQVFSVAVNLNGTQTISDSGSGITFAGPISGSIGSGMDVAGGIVTLAGSDTYVGNTTISGGTLKVASSSAIPSGSGVGNVVVSGTLDLNGTNATINGLSGSGTVDNTSSANASTLTIGANGQAGSFDGVIQNSGGASLSLVKAGTNTLTLSSGGSTYSGGTTLSAGKITLAGDSSGSGISVSSGPLGIGTVTLDGGTLLLNGHTLGNNLFALTNTMTVIDNITTDAVLDGDLSGSGTITLQNSSGNPLSDHIGNGVDVNWSGFTGTLNYISGSSKTFNLFAPTASDLNLSNATVTFSGTYAPSTFRTTSGYTTRLGALSGGSTGGIENNSTLEIGNLNTSTTFSGPIKNAGSLTKVGTGTLTLSGANTYTGPTIVSNGTLIVYSGTQASDFTAEDNATFGVHVSAADATLSIPTLTLGNSTNTFLNLNSTTTAAITVTGAGGLIVNGTVTVNASGVAITVGQYPLISFTTISGTGGFV